MKYPSYFFWYFLGVIEMDRPGREKNEPVLE